jgi:hypothetical protein
MEKDPETGKDVEFVSAVVGGSVPAQFIPGVEKVLFSRPFYPPLSSPSFLNFASPPSPMKLISSN